MSEDPRTTESCNDCMYLVYDEDWTCWAHCRGKYKPGSQLDRRRTMDEEFDQLKRNVIEKLAKQIEEE